MIIVCEKSEKKIPLNIVNVSKVFDEENPDYYAEGIINIRTKGANMTAIQSVCESLVRHNEKFVNSLYPGYKFYRLKSIAVSKVGNIIEDNNTIDKQNYAVALHLVVINKSKDTERTETNDSID